MVKEKSNTERHVVHWAVNTKWAWLGSSLKSSANSLMFGSVTAGRSVQPVATIGWYFISFCRASVSTGWLTVAMWELINHIICCHVTGWTCILVAAWIGDNGFLMIETALMALALVLDFSVPLVAFRRIFDVRLPLMNILSAHPGSLQLCGSDPFSSLSSIFLIKAVY